MLTAFITIIIIVHNKYLNCNYWGEDACGIIGLKITCGLFSWSER